MKWKDVLKMVFSALIPSMYVYLKVRHPDFPLSQDNFTALALWVVGQMIGGWTLRGVLARAGFRIAKVDR